MRLIKIKIKNIASLRGEHFIDFSFIQNQSSLFAITGETGAGKSSILNSIGLVLYGKVYKSNVGQNDLVTLGEKEGQIDLLFQAQGKNYLATWRARVRKQNGELYSTPQTPQRELYQVDGNEFESQKTVILENADKLLNLDFDQFCKCIILNQGEFARFLSSSFTERKEILEKLYPGEMLDNLSTQLKKEKDELEKQISDLEIELNTLKGDGPQGDDLLEKKNHLESQYQLFETWHTKIESINYYFTDIINYHLKYNETLNKIQTIKEGLIHETSMANELSSEALKLSEELQVIQKEQEHRLPKLQELLRAEESLKNFSAQKTGLNEKFLKQSEHFSSLQKNLEKVTIQIKQWEIQFQECTNSFILPRNELDQYSQNIDEIFELFNRKEIINQEITTKSERLEQLTIQGKEETLALSELRVKKETFSNEKEKLAQLEEQKNVIIKKNDLIHRAQVQHEEIKLKSTNLVQEINELESKKQLLSLELTQLKDEYTPIETTIKLQSLLNAIEICLTHPQIEETGQCPVCHTSLPKTVTSELRASLKKTNFVHIKDREQELSKHILKKEAEITSLDERHKSLSGELRTKESELDHLKEILSEKIIGPQPIEDLIKVVQKNIWEQEKIIQDENRLTQTIQKSREQYLSLKKELSEKQLIHEKMNQQIAQLRAPLSFIGEIDESKIQLLKSELKKLSLFKEIKTRGDQIEQEKKYLTQNIFDLQTTLNETQKNILEINNQISTISGHLLSELKDQKASELINDLNQRVKQKNETLNLKERELKIQQLKLKESQSKLHSLEDLLKDMSTQFSLQIQALKDLALTDLPRPTEEIASLIEKLSGLTLTLNSPEILFVPLKDIIQSQKDFLKIKTSELKMSFASVRARFEDWQKRQEKINHIIQKTQELKNLHHRRLRLYEVLGKDELRTFVLSLVEENLIIQTNSELQKLCQGRYEIIHQSKRMKLTPEFYILDKFREGGLRKVSTLSGGETFMVSLAMALGLAEMTRGRAEIDTLFIDEGFGTLDQDSLEDVLDMLKQIQTRGLMVGIISHIKALTISLPVNLHVSKKQDGNSSLKILYN